MDRTYYLSKILTFMILFINITNAEEPNTSDVLDLTFLIILIIIFVTLVAFLCYFSYKLHHTRKAKARIIKLKRRQKAMTKVPECYGTALKKSKSASKTAPKKEKSLTIKSERSQKSENSLIKRMTAKDESSRKSSASSLKSVSVSDYEITPVIEQIWNKKLSNDKKKLQKRTSSISRSGRSGSGRPKAKARFL